LLEIEKFNAAGGLGGRMIERVRRDTKGKPEDPARHCRELVNSDGCEILFDSESSAGAFAIHEVAKDLGVVVMPMNSETTSLTADPKLPGPSRSPVILPSLSLREALLAAVNAQRRSRTCISAWASQPRGRHRQRPDRVP
jgi:hypothetical protein